MATSIDLLKTTVFATLLYLTSVDWIQAQISNTLSPRAYNREQQIVSGNHYKYSPPVSRNATATPSLKNQLDIKPNQWSPDIFINNEITEAIGDTVIYIQTLWSRDPASLVYTINSIVIKTWTDPEKDIVIDGLNILCRTSGPIKTDEENAVLKTILDSGMAIALPEKAIECIKWKVGR